MPPIDSSSTDPPPGDRTLEPQCPAHPHPLDGIGLRRRIQDILDLHIAHQRSVLAEVGVPVTDLVDAVAALLTGGKRLRAAFLYWGHSAFTGEDSTALVTAASAVEVFQAAALLHDDVMDNSDLRRGRPTAHRAFAARHTDARWSGDPAAFGQAAAILAGDLCLNWCDEIFSGCGLPADQIARARPVFDVMRTQLMGGQYLDVLHAARGWTDLPYTDRIHQCRTVIRYKSAKYSVEHPLLIGAHAGDAPAGALQSLSRYGTVLGEAFQLRDDVLGVFGDPLTTGKPAGDDLREGKHTVLLAHVLEHGTPAQTRMVSGALGRDDLGEEEVAACREALQDSGALARTEQMIDRGCAQAHEALDRTPGLSVAGHRALTDLIAISTARAT